MMAEFLFVFLKKKRKESVVFDQFEALVFVYPEVAKGDANLVVAGLFHWGAKISKTKELALSNLVIAPAPILTARDFDYDKIYVILVDGSVDWHKLDLPNNVCVFPTRTAFPDLGRFMDHLMIHRVGLSNYQIDHSPEVQRRSLALVS